MVYSSVITLQNKGKGAKMANSHIEELKRLRELRLPIVGELYALGATQEEMATSLGVSPVTIGKDVAMLRQDRKLKDAPVASMRFALQFRHFVELSRVNRFHTNEVGVVFTTLSRVLRIDDILRDLEVALEAVYALKAPRMIVPEWAVAVPFFDAVFNIVRSRNVAPEIEWREFVRNLSVQDIPDDYTWKGMRNDVIHEMTVDTVAHKGIVDIAPYWDVDPMPVINAALATLAPKDEKVIRQRIFEGKTLQEVGDGFGVTGSRVRQWEADILGKLRPPRLSRTFQPFVQTPNVVVSERISVATELAQLRAHVAALHGVVPLDELEALGIPLVLNSDLVLSVDELELSERTKNCLANADIRFIGELVFYMNETRLLRIKNFGRKCFSELSEELWNEKQLRIADDRYGEREREKFDAWMNKNGNEIRYRGR